MKRWEFNDLSNPGPHFTFKDRFISSPLILTMVASRHCLTFLLPAEALFLLFYWTNIFILEKFKELTIERDKTAPRYYRHIERYYRHIERYYRHIERY